MLLSKYINFFIRTYHIVLTHPMIRSKSIRYADVKVYSTCYLKELFEFCGEKETQINITLT